MGLGFWVWVSGFGFGIIGVKVEDLVFRVIRVRVQGLGFRVEALGFGLVFGIRVWD